MGRGMHLNCCKERYVRMNPEFMNSSLLKKITMACKSLTQQTKRFMNNHESSFPLCEIDLQLIDSIARTKLGL